jgi:citrate synthase
MLAAAAARDPLAFDLRAASVALKGLQILRLLTTAAANSDPGEATIDVALARQWNVGLRGVDVVRAALVLSADHELNVSSFTARCVASAGSHPYAVVIAGLAALEGPKHGGASARVESMLESMRRARPLRGAAEARLRRGSFPSAGHPLCHDGTPRAGSPRSALRALRNPPARFIIGSLEPQPAPPANINIDFGLAAVSRVLKLPPDRP